MLALAPVIDSDPIDKLFRRSRAALPIVNKLLELPRLPEPLKAKVPAVIVVAPE